MATTTQPGTPAHGEGLAQKARVLYDGACPLCRKSVRLLQDLDWRNALAFVNVRDPEQIRDLLARVPRERLFEEMHLITPEGQHVYHGFEAFRWLAWRLPLLWAAAPFLYLPGMKALGQQLYLWVARNRFRLLPCHGGVCTLPAR